MKHCKQFFHFLLFLTITTLTGNHLFGQPSDTDPNAREFPFSCNTGPTDCNNLIPNNTFVTHCVNPNDTWGLNNYPFVSCVDYWTWTHGTPQIPYDLNYLPRIAARTDHAVMWASATADNEGNISLFGEGIAVGIQRLTANTAYQLSFSERMSNNGSVPLDNYYFVLMTCAAFNSIRKPFDENSSTLYSVPAIPAFGTQIIYNGTNTSNLSWANVTKDFVPNASNYDVLWIFPRQFNPIPFNSQNPYLHIALPTIKKAPCFTPSQTCPEISPSGPIEYWVLTDAGIWGRTLTASTSTGNQWYYNGNPIPGATGQTYRFEGGYNASGVSSYHVVNNGCTSNVVQVRFKQYGYGNFGEEMYDRLGAKFHPISTSGYYCYNTTNNAIRQFNLGTSANYNWNFFTQPSSGTQSMSITPGSYNPGSYQAQINVGASIPATYTWVQGIANLNGNEKIIDYSINLSHPQYISTSTQVCLNAGHNIVNFNGSSYSTIPSGSGFDWEEYDFGVNGTIFSGPGAGSSTILIPGRSTPQTMLVKFTGPSVVKKYFYYNNGGCYKEEYNVTINTGCRVQNEETDAIKIYPNPATSRTTISSALNSIIKVEISDLINLYVKTIKVDGLKTVSINVTDLKPGIYNCKIVTSKGFENKKLMIKR